MLKWYEQIAADSDVVISSRIRLARNLDTYPFSERITEEQAVALVNEVKGITDALSEANNRKFYACNISTLSDIDKTAMVERHIVSPLLAEKKQTTGLIMSEDETISIMINEEDHVRIQAIIGGMNLEQAYEEADRVDDIAYEKLHFAYDEKYGYLTSCPTNAGTGIRASCMVFLPALSAGKMIQKLIEEVGKYGVTVRGIYGEGTKSLGSIYQISNQKTLGNSESEIIENLKRVVLQVVKQERKRREYMMSVNSDELEDQVFRSYGILKYARQISSDDAMTLLSQLKFGMDCGLIKFDRTFNIHKLMMGVQPGSLQWTLGKNVGSTTRDQSRAEYIRKELPTII
ncbi:protein arginine kinase [Lachnospiraceae bacterium MD1]|uniref:Protein-arginine kinase n=1 Tax=Variimorphobacter saccharofermentans TaxID=2755051 RepID=A0A839K467_9FIRM|nr:protein arginine kinase [Variimorphobacter saccharofermentans]MBB2184147.1 protein arginine kinase [Variimorphobacter saccharofermentans]